MKTLLQVEVEYDPSKTCPEDIASDMDHLIDLTRNDGLYDRVFDDGSRAFSFTAAPSRLRVRASAIKKIVDYDPEPDASYAVDMAKREGWTDELEAIEKGELVGYYCKALVEITIPESDNQPDYCTDRALAGIRHTIASPGLWGIFAKSDEDPYFDEVFAEERMTLIDMLTKMGIEVEG
jgi:hypothetical protein